MSVKREDLIKAAKELNNVLGLDPRIKTGKKVTEKELSEQILEAAELILPEDDISEETMRVIKLLKDESVEDEKEQKVKKDMKRKIWHLYIPSLASLQTNRNGSGEEKCKGVF